MRECHICGSTIWIECHHVFFGSGVRKLSDKYGMTVDLCHWCHNEPPGGVHFNRKEDLKLKVEFQKKFEEENPDLDFLKIFGRNYL